MNLKHFVSILIITVIFSLETKAQIPPPPPGNAPPGLGIPGLGIGIVIALLFGIYKIVSNLKKS